MKWDIVITRMMSIAMSFLFIVFAAFLVWLMLFADVTTR